MTSTFEFVDPRELVALRHSCLLEDDLDRLRAELATSTTLVVKGSTGQPVETPLLGAIRNAVALQAKLLASIAVDTSQADRSHAGRALVSQRWRTMANYRRPVDKASEMPTWRESGR